MRYYVLRTPDGKEYEYSNVRKLRDLPEGTTISRHITDRDGSLIDVESIPVENGKAQIAGRGKQRARIHYG